MTREPDANLPVIFRIDGRKIKSANDFYREIGSSVNGPGGYFGRNLDALADCLRGGFGTPKIGHTNSNGNTARCRSIISKMCAAGSARCSMRYRTSSTTPEYR
ncbi:barstar family protein [Mycobacterium sp.]|uniref:barstar family protein n=1 Tax=Mycobacterium sp. TaxID=1785 RepID=UPI003F94E8A0